MPATNVRIGPSQMFLELKDLTVTLPSMDAVTIDVTAGTPTINDILDVQVPISTTTDKQVILGALGYDQVNGGYTIAECSPATPAALSEITLTSGQGLAIHIDNADFATNLGKALAIVTFLIEGTADPVLCQMDVIDPAKDFDAMVCAAPHPAALSFTEAVLNATTTHDDLGSRVAYGRNSRLLGPTIDGVGVNFNTETVNVNLDSGPAFPVPTARQPSVDFKVAENTTRNFVSANAGIFTRFIPSGAITVDSGKMGLASAIALIKGNTAMRAILPPDNQGISETWMFLGLLGANASTTNVRFTKTSVPTVDFNIPGAAMDRLLYNMHTLLIRRYKE